MTDYYEEQGGRQVHDPFKNQKPEEPNNLARSIAIALIVLMLVAFGVGITVLGDDPAGEPVPVPTETVVPQAIPPPIPDTPQKLQRLADQAVVLMAAGDGAIAEAAIFYHEENGNCDIAYAAGAIPDVPVKAVREARAAMLKDLRSQFDNVVTATVPLDTPIEQDGYTASTGELLLASSC